MQIQESRCKFLGSRFWQDTQDLADDERATVAMRWRTPSIADFALGDLRALKADLERNGAAELLAACEQAHRALLERVPGSVPGGEEACEALRQAIATARGE